MMQKMWRRLVPVAGAVPNAPTGGRPSLRATHSQRRRLTSLLSAVALFAGVAAIAVVAAPAASATANNPGYYAANNVTGYCVDAGAAKPTGQDYTRGTDGGGVTMVISWFATHYGPQNAAEAFEGGPLYPGSIVLDTVTNPTATASKSAGEVQREGILRAAQVSMGTTPDDNESNGSDPFFQSLLAFAQAHPGPWTLARQLDPGPYTAGTAYNGFVAVHDANGNPVPVAGIHVDATGQTNVSIGFPGGHDSGTDGRVAFTFTPTAAGPFDASFTTADVAGSAAIWNGPGGPPNGTSGYQRLLVPARGSADTAFQASAVPNQVQPSLSTQISTQTAIVGAPITDNVTVTNSNGYNGQIQWFLFGPVPAATTPSGAGTCVGVSYAGAPLAASGSLTAAGDNTYTTTPFTVTAVGCYTYSEFLVGNATTKPAGPTTPGTVTETVIVFATQPALSTQISKQSALVGDTITDDVTVTNSLGYQGPVVWGLFGPVAPTTNGLGGPTCAGVTYAGAPLAQSGSIAVNGDNTYTTTPFTVTAAGCYTYSEYLVGNATTAPAGPTTPGTVTETVIVFSKQPTISTQISKQTALLGDTITDDIVITNSGGYVGPVIWALYGPVAAVTDTKTGSPTCVGVSYTGAPIAASGVIAVNGDNTYQTPAYTVAAVGCYTYSEYLVGNATTAPAGPTTPGLVTETVIVFQNKPQVSTQISKQTSAVGDTISDTIAVTGSGGYQGPVTWTLLGPVAPKATASGAGTCEGVDYTGAPVAATGSITVNGNGVYATTGFKVKAAGCYTYSEYLVGNTTTTPVGPTTPGTSTETTITTFVPQISTQASKQTAAVGDTITDAIKVTNSGGYKGPVTWKLLGPVAPKLDSSGAETCVGVNWTNAPVAATGSVTVNGDNTYTTKGFTVAVTGCYTYSELLVGNTTTTPAGPTTPGTSTETVLVKTPGTPSTLPLATTGSDVGLMTLGGLLLLATGGALVIGTRRRRKPLAE